MRLCIYCIKPQGDRLGSLVGQTSCHAGCKWESSPQLKKTRLFLLTWYSWLILSGGGEKFWGVSSHFWPNYVQITWVTSACTSGIQHFARARTMTVWSMQCHSLAYTNYTLLDPTNLSSFSAISCMEVGRRWCGTFGCETFTAWHSPGLPWLYCPVVAVSKNTEPACMH